MIAQADAKAIAMRILQHREIESACAVDFVLQPRTRPAAAREGLDTPRNIRWRQIRERLSEAQNHRCCYCGKRSDADATIDHVVARYHGGTDAQSNLVMACKRCNELRGCRNAYDFFDSEEWLVPRSACVGRQSACLGALWPAEMAR